MPGEEVNVELSAPESSQPSTPAPEASAPVAEKPMAAEPEVPEEKLASDDKDEKKAGQMNDGLEQLQPPPQKVKDKKHHKDPMMELVDELSDFVGSVNDAIEEFFKDKGKKALDAAMDTGPGRALSQGLDEAKEAMGRVRDALNDRMDMAKDTAVNAVADSFNAIKDKIVSAFTKVKEETPELAKGTGMKGSEAEGPEIKMSAPEEAESAETNDLKETLGENPFADSTEENHQEGPSPESDKDNEDDEGLRMN